MMAQEVVTLTQVIADSEDDLDEGDDVALIEPSDLKDNQTTVSPHKDYYCGIWACHPKWLQVFAKKKVFTLLLFLFALVEGAIVSGFTSIVLSSLEKRYSFTSTAVGFVAVSYDTVSIFSGIIVGYLGGRHNSHKPRWMGLSLVLIGIGSFIFASPEFLFGLYNARNLQNSTNEQCNDDCNTTTVDCSSSNDIAYSVYIVGNSFIAFGAASLFTLGPAFIDEIVFPKYVALHIAVYQIGTLLGPAVGYGLGSFFLSIYVDPWEITSLKSSDPSWVGGWWLCFVFSGVSCFALSIPFLMYPKSLPDSHIVQAAREKEMLIKPIQNKADAASLLKSSRTFLIHLKRLLTNMPFMFQTISLSVIFILVSGMASFGPQYMEIQYHFSATSAGLIAGGVAITAACSGIACGALIVHFAKLRGRKLAGFITIVLAALILGTPAFLLSCTSIDIAGVTVPYINGSTDGIDGAQCNSGCGCSSSVYEPVCGRDGVTYFSPCRAGCTSNHGNDIFLQCSCVAQQIHSIHNDSISYDSLLMNNSTAVSGLCKDNCTLTFVFFMMITLMTFFFAFFAHIPVIYFTIRVVADDERSFALGLQASIGRLLGTIPGPLVFGAIYDSACLKWQGVCGRNGNCWIYNNKNLGLYAFYLALPCAIVAALFSFLALIAHPKDKKVLVVLELMTDGKDSSIDDSGDSDST